MPSRQPRRLALVLVALLLAAAAQGADPKDNPIATFYSGPAGYPAWTDDLRWSKVINMKTYTKGKTDYERFEKARDEAAGEGGGGTLYYPAGTYDFSNLPPGRGLFLRKGVVIRGEAPQGKPLASDGKLELPTKFLFPFRKRGGGQVPGDWNLIGIQTDKGKKLREVGEVGIAWVHLVGATVYFGPQMEWGKTWGTAGSLLSDQIKKPWARRVPDGTHPGDPLAGGGKKYEGAGQRRLVFGCVLEDSAGLDDFSDPGYGPDGFHTQRHGARIAVYGSRVLVANNLLPPSAKNFKHRQKTRPQPKKGMDQVLFDYGKTIGIDVNKEMLLHAAAGGACPGYFEEGVVVRDNHVYNHGHKGYNISGNWVTIAGNRNERTFLRQGGDVYGLGAGWVLTLDGHHVAGPSSDNRSRAFDLAGRNLWVDNNRFNNTGSSPGNDGEGILGQARGGTPVYSWAITRNVHTPGSGLGGSLGGKEVDCHGLLIGWNQTAGSVGSDVSRKDAKLVDCAFIANKARRTFPDPRTVTRLGLTAPLTENPAGSPAAPTKVTATAYQGDAVKVTWADASDNEVGFRVERRLGGGEWQVIAYRPPRLEGDSENPQAWVDFTAPPAKALTYRVVAINADDDDKGASKPTGPITLPQPGTDHP